MDDLSLAHSKYNCTYHIVFIPKYRRKAMFGTLRKEVGEILGKVCRNGGRHDHKGGNAARSCAYVCVNSAQIKCIKRGRRDQREKVH